MDFMDTRNPNPNFAGHNLEDHPDLKQANGAQLQRNKTERIRLQGLQRTNSNGAPKGPTKKESLNFIGRWKLWMINDGGNRMFFFIFILLHLLIGGFGMAHYSFKDNLVNNRRMLGAGFSA
jgi:NADPH oxidase